MAAHDSITQLVDGLRNMGTVLVNGDASFLTEVFDQLRSRGLPTQQHSYLNWARRKARTEETRTCLEMLSTAIDMRRLDRSAAPFAFEQRDIVEYLPVQDIAPGAKSWKALKDELLAQRGGRRKPGDGEVLKAWATQHGGSYKLPRIRAKARQRADRWEQQPGGLGANRPAEFDELARRIRESMLG